MSDPVLLATAALIASHWADDGGQPTEFAIACRDGVVLAIAELEVGKRWDDAARRAALGALVPVTECTSFGYLADTTVGVDGRTGDALLCLEVAIIDRTARAVGIKAHTASYCRKKKRFGTDVVDLDVFTELESPVVGGLIDELAAIWHLEGDQGRLGALNVLSETGIRMSDMHPSILADLEGLLAQHA